MNENLKPLPKGQCNCELLSEDCGSKIDSGKAIGYFCRGFEVQVPMGQNIFP